VKKKPNIFRSIIGFFGKKLLQTVYSQTCVQRPPLGPDKRGRYAEGYMKKISGK
jgi:hypothetical protein